MTRTPDCPHSLPQEWNRSDSEYGNVLLYTLRQDGWRKGQPVMINDVTVRIEAAHGSNTDIKPIADAIQRALSVRDQINGIVTQEAPRRQLFLDCDGVLADFDAAFEKQFGHPPRKYEEQHGPQTFWQNIREEAAEFYRHLPLMEGARELYEAVKHLRPIILTGCPLGGWAEMQKIEWAREHFPGVPIITCMSKDKRVYAQPGDILIDDYLKYRHLWEDHGGIFIHHTSVEKSLSELFALTTAQAEREQLEARVKELEEALKPFAEVEWTNSDGWTGTAFQRDRICDWFGPSDFHRARAARLRRVFGSCELDGDHPCDPSDCCEICQVPAALQEQRS